jgi:CRISPR/Cas system CMR-associated protein Cmr1 (group 7 of RAMP superfamily)
MSWDHISDPVERERERRRQINKQRRAEARAIKEKFLGIEERKCLRCDKKFTSQSKFNRLCYPCKTRDNNYDPSYGNNEVF